MTRTQAEIFARSFERWEDENGSPQDMYRPVTTVSKYGSKKMFSDGASEPENLTFAEEEQILERLGAAVTMKWQTLPRKTQRELFDYATSLADSMETVQFTGQVARFLHDRKGSDFGPVEKN